MRSYVRTFVRSLACAYVQQPHTLGYTITRRDLYSRLTTFCEGRIRSAYVTHMYACAFDCVSFERSTLLPLFLICPFFLSFALFVNPFVQPDGLFHCNDRHPALSPLPSSPHTHTHTSMKIQLDGSNWTANDHAVIRINTILSPLAFSNVLALRTRGHLAWHLSPEIRQIHSHSPSGPALVKFLELDFSTVQKKEKSCLLKSREGLRSSYLQITYCWWPDLCTWTAEFYKYGSTDILTHNTQSKSHPCTPLLIERWYMMVFVVTNARNFTPVTQRDINQIRIIVFSQEIDPRRIDISFVSESDERWKSMTECTTTYTT